MVGDSVKRFCWREGRGEGKEGEGRGGDGEHSAHGSNTRVCKQARQPAPS